MFMGSKVQSESIVQTTSPLAHPNSVRTAAPGPRLWSCFISTNLGNEAKCFFASSVVPSELPSSTRTHSSSYSGASRVASRDNVCARIGMLSFSLYNGATTDIRFKTLLLPALLAGPVSNQYGPRGL